MSILALAEEYLRSPSKGAAGAVEAEGAWACISALTLQGSTFWSDRADKILTMFADTVCVLLSADHHMRFQIDSDKPDGLEPCANQPNLVSIQIVLEGGQAACALCAG
jgi:hypothetical protein